MNLYAPSLLLTAFVALAPGATSTPLHISPEVVEVHCQERDVDADADGLDDRCELFLARSFAPLLAVRSGGCNWDDGAASGRLGGGYFFAAQRREGGGVRVAYIPAYFRDCGWSGPKCFLPWVDCAPHAGDSEMIVVDVVAHGEDAWRTEGVFLSAHCFGRSGGGCRWYRGEELERFEWVDGQSAGAPVIWVAEGRQANYPSRSACGRGHHGIDTCDRHDVRYRFPIESAAQNIGSRSHPIGGVGCVRGGDLPLESARAEPDAAECFWTEGKRFHGWTGEGSGVTPYARYLREIAGF